MTEKIGIEVSRQADSQRLAVEKVDVKRCLAAGECRQIGQWEQSNRQHAREVEGRTARRAARNNYMKKKKKRTSQSLPSCLYSVWSIFARTNCVRFNFAGTNSRFEWRKCAQGWHKLSLVDGETGVKHQP